MKNQYFGDTRDLFKYDLMLEILSKNELVNNFTFIPMLTRDEPGSGGARIDYSKARAGTERKELRNFLEKCVKEYRRNVNELERFFKQSELSRRFSLRIHKRNEYFCHETRDKYFSEITEDLLSRSLILVDPDIGLEVKSMRGKEEKYVKFNEVKLLYDRMDKNSILVIFQFIPHVKRDEYFLRIGEKLAKLIGFSVCYISDNQIVFFILTKDAKTQRSVMKTIQQYAKRYNLITGKIGLEKSTLASVAKMTTKHDPL